MNTSALKTFAPAVRNHLMEAVTRKLDFVLTTQTPDYLTTFASQVAALRELAKANRGGLIERVAYTWFNRLAALRFMDARGWHPFRARVLTPASAEETQPELLKVTRTGALPEELKSYTDPQRLNDLLDGRIPSPNAQGEVYRHLVLAACRFYHALLPNLFEKLDDETELLLPDDLLTEHSVVQGFRTEISDEDCGDGQRANVEILGWLYQFYISERKDQVMARKSAVPTEDIPAVTQLFTPHWIVRYLVENSLGRLWLLNRPNSRLREHMPYYIEDAAQVSGNDRPHPGPLPQEREKHSPPSANTDAPGASPVLEAKTKAATTTATAELFHDALSRSLSPGERAGVRASVETDFIKITKPEDIRLCDPAVGSGHMLTYAFDLLTLIYEEEGYAPTEIPALILRHNLHGLEICPRAAQLAELALVFKAREKSRRFFQPEHLVRPRIIELRDVRFAENELRDYIHALGLGDLFNQPMLRLLHQFEEAKNFGSLIQPCLDERAIANARRAIEAKDLGGQLFLRETHLKVLRVLEQAEALTQRYHVVVANPPYMGSGVMNASLKQFAMNSYADSKVDLCSMFMERGFLLAEPKAVMAMITMQSWMFLSGYEALRNKLVSDKSFLSMAHLGPRAFDTIGGEVVQSTAFVLANVAGDKGEGAFVRLVDGSSEADKSVHFLEAMANPNCGWFFQASAEKFKEIPGSPIAYWVSDKVRESFQNFPALSAYTFSDGPCKTGNDAKYLRFHWEPSSSEVGGSAKWCRCSKGGSNRKFHGNIEHVIRWDEPARAHYRKDKIARITPEVLWKRKGITWSIISGKAESSFRILPCDTRFNSVSPTIFLREEYSEHFHCSLLAFLNSRVADHFLTILNPTLALNVGNVLNIPLHDSFLSDRAENSTLVAIARADWDNFETSWDFRDQPLLRPGLKGATLEASWRNWEAQSTAAIRRMQELETENNRLFIAAYGLDGELQPEVPEAQITLARAEARRDMAAFLSYAVGCMMGRYSPDLPGLILANAGDTLREFLEKVGKPLAELTFAPDEDGIIPVLDGEWFEDDIVARTRDFLRATFGEATLRENLRFIEESLGKELRKYFLNDFFKDHLQTYKKRPIYWLVQSPKKGFSALIYLHRYTKDTINLVLNRYLRDYQVKLRNRLAHLTELQATASTAKAKTEARKEADKLTNTLRECEDWERQTLLPLAQARIELDLDDGVKVNYLKLGEALAPIAGLAKKGED